MRPQHPQAPEAHEKGDEERGLAKLSQSNAGFQLTRPGWYRGVPYLNSACDVFLAQDVAKHQPGTHLDEPMYKRAGYARQ
jgi:hypothetical protein